MVTYRFIQIPDVQLAKQARAILAIIEEAGQISKTELLTLVGARRIDSVWRVRLAHWWT